MKDIFGIKIPRTIGEGVAMGAAIGVAFIFAAFSVIMFGLGVYLTWQYAHAVFPNDDVMQVLIVTVFDGAFLVWALVAFFLARGLQRIIAFGMAVICLAGVLVTNYLAVYLGGQQLVVVEDWVKEWAFYAVVIWISVNVIALFVHGLADVKLIKAWGQEMIDLYRTISAALREEPENNDQSDKGNQYDQIGMLPRASLITAVEPFPVPNPTQPRQSAGAQQTNGKG